MGLQRIILSRVLFKVICLVNRTAVSLDNDSRDDVGYSGNGPCADLTSQVDQEQVS